MTLTVEDGTGISTADSYASVANTNTYWQKRKTLTLSSTWDDASDTQKESALRIATDYLDNTFCWLGNRSSSTQALQWPRRNVYDDRGVELSAQVPTAVKVACYELAARALSEDIREDISNEDVVEQEKVGPIEVKYRAGSSSVKSYRKVRDLLKNLTLSSGASLDMVRA